MKGVLKVKKEKQKGTPEPLAEVEAFGRRERGEAERERAAEIPKHSEGPKMKGVILRLKKEKQKGTPEPLAEVFQECPIARHFVWALIVHPPCQPPPGEAH